MCIMYTPGVNTYGPDNVPVRGRTHTLTQNDNNNNDHNPPLFMSANPRNNPFEMSCTSGLSHY
ncbi:hypothetical protein FACS1894152_0250 [Bacilli bacterium]|nr:hypothetical protein FACS1894152_0250 [Bacilli bacterium]